ncbi:MAG TPA: VCBS repeat-containing protein [Vicinamibacterales bacterium]|nr:VCBS repeat-containing protein [Vicinamibacterales bacterium]
MRRLPIVPLFVVACVIAPWTAVRAAAATITVNSTLMSTTPVQGDGNCTLIEAITNATHASHEFIDCAAGSTTNVIELGTNQTYSITAAYTNPGTAAAIALPVITNTLTINAHGSTITRTGAGAFRVFYVVPQASLTLNDLTLQGITLPDGADGAVYNDNGTLTINRCFFTGTRVAAGGSGGGAITSRACSNPTVPSCTVANKAASLTVTDSSFIDNQTLSTSSAFGAGAGINTYAVGTGAVNTATIARSRFHNNTATNQGAGVSNSAYDDSATSTLTIDRSSITANTTTGGTTPAFGGGVTNFVGHVYTSTAPNTVATLNITNSTIASNTASNSGAGEGYGGGIFNEVDCTFMVSCGGGSQANLTLTNVTIYGNAAGQDGSTGAHGAGIWSNENEATATPRGSVTLTVRDTIVAGNLTDGAIGNCHLLNNSFVPLGYNIASDNTCDASFHQFSEGQINLSALNFSAFTYYQSPQAGSVAIDRTSCNLTIDQIGTARPHGSTCDVGAIESLAAGAVHKATSDFNGDGRSDPGIFRPSVTPNALWYSVPSGGGSPFQIFFGASGDIPVAADYDGDGKADAVIWRPSTGLWYGPRTGAAQIAIQLVLGQTGDIPVPCDYNGDGAVDPAYYRPSTGQWFGTTANGSTIVLNTNLGLVAGDIPVPADYNGDGKCDPGIMRPGVGPGGTNLWYSVPSGGGSPFQIYFGAAGDIPVPGDYDGDGKADAVIFRPSTGLWYGPRTGAAQIVTQIFLGQNGDIPIAGDYDGDGAVDPAIYRPSSGLFYGTNASGSVVVLQTNFGVAAGDIATPARPHDPASYPFAFTGAVAAPARTAASTARLTKPAGTTDARAGQVVRGGNTAAATGYSVAAADAPTLALTAAPSGAGAQTLAFTATTASDAAPIELVEISIDSDSAGAVSCRAAYEPATNRIRLADASGGWTDAVTLGSGGEIRGAHCAVDADASAATIAGHEVTGAIAITLDDDFGVPVVYGQTLDAAGRSSSWQALGASGPR